MLDSFTFATIIQHAFTYFFQIEYSVRHIPGFGLTDGEGVERMWSFLRPLSTMTKEMTPTHRTELLEDALQHYCHRKRSGLGM